MKARDYHKLRQWARQAGGKALDQPQVGGLLLVALLAEFNRREGVGNQVFVGVADLFNDAHRPALFNSAGAPTGNLRALIRDVVQQEQLRHAFHPNTRDDEHRWYNTLQLQFGFARGQLSQIPDWISTQQFPLACQRLLDAHGTDRSRSFCRFIDTLRRVRTDQLSVRQAREDLQANHWILPEFIDEALSGLTADGPNREDADAESRLDLREILDWDPVLGPVIHFRFNDTIPFACNSYRCGLSCNGQNVAEWQRAGESNTFELVAATPIVLMRTTTLHYVFEGERGTIHEEYRYLWNPTAESAADVYVVGRRIANHTSVPHVAADRPLVLVTDPSARIDPPPAAWTLVRCESEPESPLFTKWSYFDPPHRRLEVYDVDDTLVWSTADALPRRQSGFEATLHNPQSGYSLQDHFRVRLILPREQAVTNPTADGRPVAVKGLITSPLQCRPHHAVSGVKLAVTLQREGQSRRHRVTVPVPVVGVARRRSADLRAEWPTATLRFSQQSRGEFCLLSTAAMPWLIEGSKPVRLRASDRMLPRNLVGRGARLAVCKERYTGEEPITIAGTFEDHGDVSRVKVEGREGEVSFWKAKPVREQHAVVLWSPSVGMAHVPATRIQCDSIGMKWQFPLPDTWPDDATAEPLAVAIAYAGECRGWDVPIGSIESFCTREKPLNAFLDTLSHFAALRWFQLPVLSSVGSSLAITNIAVIAPHKMMAAWLSLESGLEACSHLSGLTLLFTPYATADLDVLRQSMWKTIMPSAECATEFAADVREYMSGFWDEEKGLWKALQEVPICAASGLRAWAELRHGQPAELQQLRGLCGYMRVRLHSSPAETPDLARLRLAEEAAPQLGLSVDNLETLVQSAVRYWRLGAFAPDHGATAIERMCERAHHSSKYRQCLMFDLLRILESNL